MDFLILRPLSPETGYHFFPGGGGVQKFVLRSVCSAGFEQGSHWAEMTSRPVLPAFGRPGFETPTSACAAGCITVPPLLVLTVCALPLA